jgi:NADPH:quinone reductase-like Zn-dependent oxidoreductase
MIAMENVKTMRAARIDNWGELQNIQIRDIPIPEPKSGEVLIKVRAAGVNPVDVGVAHGMAQQFFSLPFTLGFDVAGDIVATSPDVHNLHVGDAVCSGRSVGSFAEYVTAPAAMVAPKPNTLDYVHAAALPIVGHFVWQALFTVGQLNAGQKVLIHAAAGGSGHIAVQLAKWTGAYVVGTASAGNEDFVRSLGADVIIDYHTNRFEEVVQDADLVVDLVGGDYYERSLDAAKPGGTVVTIAPISSDEEKAKARDIHAFTVSGLNSTQAELHELMRLVEAGVVKPVVSHIYDLDEVQDALTAISGGHTRGKTVIAIAYGR